MKLRRLLCLGLCGFVILYLSYRWFWVEIPVQVFYDTNINGLPIALLKNLRNLNTPERKQLFIDLKFAERFKPDNVCNKIKEIANPQIIVWFTNHFGQISQPGFAWYQTTIFDALSRTNATFWLVDLAAWRFLSTKKDKLLQCQDFVDFNKKQTVGIRLPPQECPLVKDRSSIVQRLDSYKAFRILYAADFFMWLQALPYSLYMVDKTIASKLIKEGLRPGSAQFFLKELGYSPFFLNYLIKDGKNMLDCDNTQIFALLQYVEGIYYSLKIIEDCITKDKKECNIVFLLPNREFSYYLVPGEVSFFDSFRNHVAWFITKQLMPKIDFKVTIYFYPFAYGHNFYEQPYTHMGPIIDNENELVRILS